MKKLSPKNYILTFKASGVSVFVTDIHRDVYNDLKALFIIENSNFRQYFLKTEFENALKKGLQFYKNNKSVLKYKKNLEAHCKAFKSFFNRGVANKTYISKSVLEEFFTNTKKLCKDYTKMNTEYTDKAFEQKFTNKNIEKNLQLVMPFKDRVRKFMNLALFEPNGFSGVLFKILSNQFNLPVPVLENLTQKELLNLYKNSKINEPKILARQKAFVSIWKTILPIEGKFANEIIKKFKEKVVLKTEVSGQIANKGKVVGKVKIIPVDYSNLEKVNREIKKMKTGSILVAETTAPELILACKMAIAIVTDLGGLMSHAAIVSREFGIPCVVGTKIATKIFKDGDTIEVNANTGVVRKI